MKHLGFPKVFPWFSIPRWLIFLLTTGLAFAFLAFLLLLTARRSSAERAALRGAPVQLLGSRREQKKLRRLVLPPECAAAGMGMALRMGKVWEGMVDPEG